MSRMRPPLTTSMTGPLTIPSFSLISSIVPQARSYCARFLERIRRPSLSSFWRTRASSSSSSETISWGSTSLRIESSRDGMTPSDLKPMSSSTSSLSILTTLPVTMSPSSNSTMVASTASANDCPPRSSKTTGLVGRPRPSLARASVATACFGGAAPCRPLPHFLLGDGGARAARRVLLRQLTPLNACSLISRRRSVAPARVTRPPGRAAAGQAIGSSCSTRDARPATSSSSGASSVGRRDAVAPGCHAVDADVVEDRRRAREQLELAGGEAGRPEVELALVALARRAPWRRSCSTPVAGSNVSPSSRWRTANGS